MKGIITPETIQFHLLEIIRQPPVAEKGINCEGCVGRGTQTSKVCPLALDYLNSLTPEQLLQYYDVTLECLLPVLPSIK